MKLTAISNPTKAKNNAKGINDTINIRNPEVIIGHNIELRIFNSVCPATMLLNNRTPKLNALAK